MSRGLLPRLQLEGLQRLVASSRVSHCQDKWQRLACAEVQLPRPAAGVPHQMFPRPFHYSSPVCLPCPMPIGLCHTACKKEYNALSEGQAPNDRRGAHRLLQMQGPL